MAFGNEAEVAYDETLPEALLYSSNEGVGEIRDARGTLPHQPKLITISRKAFWILLLMLLLIFGGGITGVGLGVGLRHSESLQYAPTRYQCLGMVTFSPT